MKIGFDISAQSVLRSGVGNYQVNLINSLLKIYKDDFFELYAFNFRNRKKIGDIKFQHDNYEIKAIPVPQRLITLWWMISSLPHLEFFTGNCDVFQISEICVQPVKKAKTVAFVHDLTTLLFPENHVRSNVMLHNLRFRNINKADAILTNSEHTKKDIIEHLKISPDKIFVTYLGADDIFVPSADSDIAAIKMKYGIAAPYMLFVGTVEPRKNLKTLIRAFNNIKSGKDIPHKLVIAGRKGWKYEDIFSEIRKSAYSSDIIYLDYIPESDLPGLMSGCDVFVYPSLYEGFGLPVLEAMKCGAPVITSNVSSLPEVGGNACIYIDPNDDKSLADNIYSVISDSALKKSMAEKGNFRAKDFSWDKCAEETMAVYRAVAGK